jgi:hypothetical protein
MQAIENGTVRPRGGFPQPDCKSFLTIDSAKPQDTTVVGCYRADRPLGTSAGSALDRSVPGAVGHRIGKDSASLQALTTFRLLPAGRVERPHTSGHGWWARGSTWNSAGDTLHVTLSTMTSGWLPRVERGSGGGEGTYVGTARYLTDAIVQDTLAWKPPQVAVRIWREACAQAADRRPTSPGNGR